MVPVISFTKRLFKLKNKSSWLLFPIITCFFLQGVTSLFIILNNYYVTQRPSLPSFEFWIKSQSHHLFVIPIFLFIVFHFGMVYPRRMGQSLRLFVLVLFLSLANILIGLLPTLFSDIKMGFYSDLKLISSVLFQLCYWGALFYLVIPIPRENKKTA